MQELPFQIYYPKTPLREPLKTNLAFVGKRIAGWGEGRGFKGFAWCMLRDLRLAWQKINSIHKL
jgi:hypothetical protein